MTFFFFFFFFFKFAAASGAATGVGGGSKRRPAGNALAGSAADAVDGSVGCSRGEEGEGVRGGEGFSISEFGLSIGDCSSWTATSSAGEFGAAVVGDSFSG